MLPPPLPPRPPRTPHPPPLRLRPFPHRHLPHHPLGLPNHGPRQLLPQPQPHAVISFRRPALWVSALTGRVCEFRARG